MWLALANFCPKQRRLRFAFANIIDSLDWVPRWRYMHYRSYQQVVRIILQGLRIERCLNKELGCSVSSSSMSINAILRQNPQIRLYIPPICWTSLHLQFLECYFKNQIWSSRNGQSGTKSIATSSEQQQEAINTAIGHLCSNSTADFRNEMVQDLLSSYNFYRW